MTDSDVKDMVVRAWKNARENPLPCDNKEKAKRWIGALAEQLKHRCKKDGEDIRVFWKGMKDRDKDFEERKELLFDVSVIQCKETASFVNSKKIRYFVNKCLWLVESELSPSSKSVIVDLSKLVMGSSKRKLFVAGVPLWKGQNREEREKQVLEMCREAADRCGEHLYFCFILYPKEWNETDIDEYGPSVWLRTKPTWRKL